MDRESAKNWIKENVSCLDYLQKSKGGMYCCPFCGSGTGPNKSGAVKYYPRTNTIACFASCATNSDKGRKGTGCRYDVIDLEAQASGCDYVTAFSLLAERYNLILDSATEARIEAGYKAHKEAMKQAAPTSGPAAPERPETAADEQTATDSEAGPQEGSQGAKMDFREYYKACAARIADPAAVSYLKGRGISLETAKKCGVGFDPQADPANAPGMIGEGSRPHPCPRIILPTTSSHYVARSIDPNMEKYKKVNPSTEKGAGSPGLFNGSALQDEEAEVIFITEGAFDALAIMEAGAQAIAINSTSNAKKLIEHLEKRPPAADGVAFVLCLDNDDAGKNATEVLQAGLLKQNISCITADICGAAKDPNAALVADRAAFTDAVTRARIAASTHPDSVSYYIDSLMAADMEKQKNIIKTGFSSFDRKFGGLYPGLYTFMAISSLGKTTFCSQMADQIAEQGNDVLFFSMEMSRLEMVTKSINRYAARENPKSGIDSLKIRRGEMNAEQRQLVAVAAQKYTAAVGNRVSIIEGDFKCDIPFIGNYIRQYIARNNVRPVVFIDYLQIIEPGENKGRAMQIKETMDEAVKLFKQLTRELSVPIVVISSVNRASYLSPLGMESSKESGMIEYTSDVVLGLQLQVMNSSVFSEEKKADEKRKLVEAAIAEYPRKVELKCMKNRYGRPGIRCNMLHYPALDLFQEEDAPPFEPSQSSRATKRI